MTSGFCHTLAATGASWHEPWRPVGQSAMVGTKQTHPGGAQSTVNTQVLFQLHVRFVQPERSRDWGGAPEQTERGRDRQHQQEEERVGRTRRLLTFARL
jgi:hypothetical protein